MLNHLANLLESLARQPLSEVISTLMGRINLEDLDLAGTDMGPEEMPFDQEMLSTSSNTPLVSSKR